jgi:hypothetical protein
MPPHQTNSVFARNPLNLFRLRMSTNAAELHVNNSTGLQRDRMFRPQGLD